MLDILEKLMKEYNKNVQKTKIRAICRSGVQSKEVKKAKTKRLGEQESKQAKKSISTASKGLQESVKGQFGKKVTKVLDTQKKTLDTF